MPTPKPKAQSRPFCFSVKGQVKMLRLVRDVINSLVTAVFLITVSILALIPKSTTYIVLGGVFGLVASVFCMADGALIYRKLLFNPSGPYQKSAAHDKF
ncbi:chemokine-like factor isoform X3 [Phacochoerus africanus]|uniref:chemokine-like factor isoform X3 n=1 Tax=Phacochoerus africanus TaxID=41426 RepID=UPI001FD92730|nr:chemokine-like factor isoform X3 [Phacochoerus africanus]